MNSLSSKIKKRMEVLDLSIHSLEKRAGLKPSAVQNIIYGRSKNPSITLIKAIAEVLNCPVDDLINENPTDETKFLKENLEKNNYLPEKNNELKWDQKLYLECFKKIHEILEQKEVSTSKNKIIYLIEELYSYSIGNNNQKPEHYFANWLIDKNS